MADTIVSKETEEEEKDMMATERLHGNEDAIHEKETKESIVGEEKLRGGNLSWLLGLGLSLLPSNHLDLSPRWHQWFLRGQSGLLLMSCFYTIVCMGPIGLYLLTNIVQAASFHEVMSLGHATTGVEGMQTWCWLLLLTGNIYWSDPELFPFPHELLLPICFSVYLLLIAYFLLSIRHTSHCLPRYALLGWAHAAVLFLGGQAALSNLTLRHGMAWTIFAFLIITINDIAAYMFGFFFGQTPLIVLSPRKTVEGYLGGGLVTIILGPLLGLALQSQPSLLCPTSALFPIPFPPTSSLPSLYTGSPSPFLLHCAAISLFASTLGPMAGFFCSGFKRACNRKNFGSLIPGHGGVLDRCDCMFLMASFTFVYVETFVY